MKHLYGCGLHRHKLIQCEIKLSMLDCNVLTTCLLRVIAHLSLAPFEELTGAALFSGVQLLLLRSHQSSCDQSHSLKLGLSIFLPLMATVPMCAAAALSQPLSLVVAVPGCQSPLLVPGTCQEKYLARGVWARLSFLCSLLRDMPESLLACFSHGFLNCVTEGSVLSWAEVSGVFLSCSSALTLPPSVNGWFECDESKVPKLFQFLTSCWVHRICLLCAHFE